MDSKIVFLGAGNVATHLSKSLQNGGFNICQVYSRTKKSAETLATALNCDFTTNIESINRDADIYIFSVSDNVLENVISNFGNTSKILIHTAGSISLDVFNAYGKNYGVLYPLQTFSKEKDIDFSNIPLCLEASNKEALLKIEAIAKALSSNIHHLSSEQRKLLHISAVFACNFSNHMIALGQGMLEDNGIDKSIISPLIKETFEKLNFLDAKAAQTGPAVRNDENVINNHLELLSSWDELQKLYGTISKNIVDNHNK